jgi:hypothetical protein
MERLVLDYTHCAEPDCWNHDIPFEYESKEKFIFDVIKNPMLLNDVIECVYEWQLEEKVENELLDNIDQYIFTLDEWFERNKRKVT